MVRLAIVWVVLAASGCAGRQAAPTDTSRGGLAGRVIDTGGRKVLRYSPVGDIVPATRAFSPRFERAETPPQKPVSARVTAIGRATGRIYKTTTDPTGRFEFRGIPSGTYDVEVTVMGGGAARRARWPDVVVELAKWSSLEIVLDDRPLTR